MKLQLIESETTSRITFMGKRLFFYDKGIYHKTEISSPHNILVIDENQNIVSSSSSEITPNSVISDDDIKSIVEFYNRTGNLTNFYLYEQDI